jgi:succinoglycan biosynthesis protein ExoV
LTAKALGLPAQMSLTDPAALVRTVMATPPAKARKVSFIPHFRSPGRAEVMGVDLGKLCAELGIHYIDPRGEVVDVLESLASSEVVLAEAMHGAIVSDALRIPWVPIQLFDHILNLKWLDWCGSLNMRYSPFRHVTVPGKEIEGSVAHFLREAAESERSMLSADDALARVIERLLTRLGDLKRGGSGACLIGSADFTPDPGVLSEVPWLHEMQTALEEVAQVVPPGATLILIDEERWGGGQALRGRRTLPFLEHEGRYWGLPPDGSTAIRELERLRESGADYLVVMWPSFWWLSYYDGLRDHLDRYPTLASNDRILVVYLKSAANSPVAQ